VRHLAAEALGDLGDPAALPALLTALAGPDEEGVRWRAAEGLARLGEPAVAGLAALAEDGDPDVRWKAIVALGDIGDHRAAPTLRGRLADPDRFVRGRAVSALARLGAQCLPLMLEALTDSEPRVRQGAAEVLGQVGDRAAVEGLLEALQDPAEPVRRAAAVASSGSARWTEPAETRMIPRLRRTVYLIWRALSSAGRKGTGRRSPSRCPSPSVGDRM
jgi:HEAT repeat protein